MTLGEIRLSVKRAKPGSAFGDFNAMCEEDVYECVYRNGDWYAYSKLQGYPIIESGLTVVDANWKPGRFMGLIQSGPVTVFAGELPKGVKIPEGAKVYTIGDPTKGLIDRKAKVSTAKSRDRKDFRKECQYQV